MRDRSNVLSACGSGTCSPSKDSNAANSRLRPARVASAITGSMWSVKNWNGARSSCSSPMKSSGVESENSTTAKATRWASRRQPVTDRPVPDLVVVLGGDDEPLGLGPLQLAHDAFQAAEPGVVPVVLAGQQHVQLVVQVVEPHRVVPPLLERTKVVVPLLAHQEPVDALAQLTQDVQRRLSS